MAITLEQFSAWLGTSGQGGPSIIEDTNPARELTIGRSAETNSATIAESMNNLVATVKTNLETDAQARNALCTCRIQECLLIAKTDDENLDHALLQQIPERQREDQTQMLRALATGSFTFRRM
jgi:hypothetical protein